jgi:hypothetical protein
MKDYAYASRQEFLRPSMSWEVKLAICFFIAAIIIGLSSSWANAETVTFQSKDSTLSGAKCPFKPDATMSVSIWNSGGWPLWRITCWRKDHKQPSSTR